MELSRHAQQNPTIDAKAFGIIDIRNCRHEGLRTSTCIRARPWMATLARCSQATSSPACPRWVCHDGGRGIPVRRKIPVRPAAHRSEFYTCACP